MSVHRLKDVVFYKHHIGDGALHARVKTRRVAGCIRGMQPEPERGGKRGKRECSSRCKTVEAADLQPRTDHRYVALVMVVPTRSSLFPSRSPRRLFFSSRTIFFPISLSLSVPLAGTVRPAVPLAVERIARKRREGVDDPRKEGKRERGPRGKVARVG